LWNKKAGHAVFFCTNANHGELQESAMIENAGGNLSARLRRAAGFAVAASAMLTAGAAHANSANSTVLVPPKDLPELARQSGESMFLYDTIDGRAILYIEQNRGAQLASFDVTDPAHIKSEGLRPLDASGAFDFVAPAGDRAELVRYRQGRGDAILDLHNTPTLKKITDGGANPQELNRAFDAKQGREEITKADTGTTFVLAENGLIVIRRPDVEWLHQLMVIPPN
jgi:hypothetical protein